MRAEDICLEAFHLSVVIKVNEQILIYNPDGSSSMFFSSYDVICSTSWNRFQELQFQEWDPKWTTASVLNL